MSEPDIFIDENGVETLRVKPHSFPKRLNTDYHPELRPDFMPTGAGECQCSSQEHCWCGNWPSGPSKKQ